MSDCCSPKGYREIFSERSARAQAKRYRRRGLDGTSRRIVDIVRRRDVTDQSLLEVGGGVGAIQLELLKVGVARAVSVELTPTYEDAASRLIREAGFESRVERQVMDFADAGDTVGAADIVVLNRVICCYPDMPKLAGAAADHTRAILVMSFPNGRWWTRLGFSAFNAGLRALRREFQAFVHPPNLILATAGQHGLQATVNQGGLVWQVVAFERAA